MVDKNCRWSYGAIECHLRKCICGSECSNYFWCKKYTAKNKMPPMKKSVIEIIKNIGTPSENDLKIFEAKRGML